QEPVTSAGRVGGRPLSMPDAPHPDVGALLPALVQDAGLDVVDAWGESPAGAGPGPVREYLAGLTGLDPGDDPIVLPPLVPEIARSALDYGAHGPVEAAIACAFVADTVHDLVGRVLGREEAWEVKADAFDAALPFVTAHRHPEFLAGLAGEEGPRHLDADFELVQDTFRRFASDKVAPVAEHVHRANADIPEDVIEGLAEIGGFGLSVPEEYGG